LSRPKVCIYRPVDGSGATHRLLEEAGCDVVVGSAGATSAEVARLARGADALMGATYRGGLIDATLLAVCPALRIISKYTIGIDDIDLDAATARAVLVTHCPTEANWGGVAEGTLALMLGLLKRLRERDRQVKSGGWRDPALAGTYVGARRDGYAGITVGIVGLGRVGSRVADLLAPWRVRLLACDPYVDEAHFIHHGAQAVDLPTLLRESDVVTLHSSLSEETRNLIARSELALMRPSAVLINTARGALVDVEALTAALESGRLAGAALDVLPEEPPPADLELLKLGDKVLLSPHMVAANCANPLESAAGQATEAVLAALRGVVPQRVCNREAVAAWRARYADENLLSG
jgi:phosphoglycerate dehydrogenase-like enzyme